MPPRRRFRLESVPPPDREELLPVELNGRNYEIHFDPRCGVCRLGSDGVLMVNRMLTEGFTYRDIIKQVQSLDIPNKPKNVTSQAVRNHYENHLPAKSAAVRTIIEQRAAKMQQNFIEGTENLVSPYIYAEVMMQKAFHDMVDSNEKITAKDGIEAAKLLHQFTKEEQSNADVAEAYAQLNRIIGAVRDIVPQDMFSKIINRVQNGNQIEQVESEPDDEDSEETGIDDKDDEEEYEPE